MKNKRIDWALLSITIVLVLIGIALVYSTSHGIKSGLSSLVNKQILWVGISIPFFIFFSIFDYRNLRKVSYLLYFISLLTLLLVLLIGRTRAGSSRWLSMGNFFLQPSEFSKLIFILTAARYFTDIKEKITRIPFLIFYFLLVAIPLLLILKQPNLGTAVVILFISLGMLWAAGIKKSHFVLLAFLGILFSPILWCLLKDYQKTRLLVLFNPNTDPLGSGYNILQSKIAIGSGGLIGKGFLRGTQTHLAFLPEYHTDFIFCVLAEEWGFIGAGILLFVYYLLLKNIIRIARSTAEPFARLVTVGIVMIFASHIFINLGMTLGILPVVGLPLPFLSYGGSSLLASLISIGILLNIRKNRTIF